MSDLKDDLISSFFNFDEIKENILIEKKDFSLFKNKNLKIIIFTNKKEAFIFDNENEIKIENDKIDNEVLRYVIYDLFYKQEKISIDIVGKLLFSTPFYKIIPFLKENNFVIGKSRTEGAKEAHKRRGNNIKS